MRLIITELTEMHGGNYCVAGWEAQGQRMIRPLPNGANWTAGLLQQHGISPGAAIDVVPSGQQHSSVYPHRTEDTPIDGANIQLANVGPINWFGAGSPPSSATVDQAFGGHLSHSRVWNGAMQGVYVPEGTQVGSLNAVAVAVGNLQFFEDSYQGKTSLRAYIDDGNGCYNLPIVAKSLREAYRQGGVGNAQQLLPQHGNVHMRLGLARAWPGQPGRCSLMINGVYG